MQPTDQRDREAPAKDDDNALSIFHPSDASHEIAEKLNRNFALLGSGEKVTVPGPTEPRRRASDQAAAASPQRRASDREGSQVADASQTRPSGQENPEAAAVRDRLGL